MDALYLAESSLLKARYHGLLPMHVDVQAIMGSMRYVAMTWTDAQQAEALAWCERMRAPGTDPAPAHVAVLIQRAVRDYARGDAA